MIPQRFDDLVQTQTTFLFETSSPFLFSYLAHRKNEKAALDLWHAILSVITANMHDADRTRKMAMEVTQVAHRGELPRNLKPKSNELDGMIGHLLGGVLKGANSDLELVKTVFGAHGMCFTVFGHPAF
jgi:hypothetical protein